MSDRATLLCSDTFLETAAEIYAGGSDDSDGQFIPALIHDAKVAHRLAATVMRVREIIGPELDRHFESWMAGHDIELTLTNYEARELAELLK
jgi:hypothetical protein